jgi:hypothetical protein
MRAPLLHAIFTGALLIASVPLQAGSARNKLKTRRQRQRHRQQHIPATPVPALAGSTAETSAAVHHLFSTPLYVANLSSSKVSEAGGVGGVTVNADALASLALDGYSIVAANASVQRAIIQLRLAMHDDGHSSGGSLPQVSAQLNDDSIFTHNDKFFYYQMGNAARCRQAAAPECAGVRWHAFFESPALGSLEAAIKEAAPRYLATAAGVRESEIPSYSIKLWASVMVPGASHTEHEHSSAGMSSDHAGSPPLLSSRAPAAWSASAGQVA